MFYVVHIFNKLVILQRTSDGIQFKCEYDDIIKYEYCCQLKTSESYLLLTAAQNDTIYRYDLNVKFDDDMATTEINQKSFGEVINKLRLKIAEANVALLNTRLNIRKDFDVIADNIIFGPNCLRGNVC